MAICGINVNLNNLQGELQSRISGFLNLGGSLGGAAGIANLTATLPTGLASIRSQVTSMVPATPNVSGFLSLRSELASLSIMSIGTPAALSKLASISSNFGGLTSLSGFANINLNDLASSAFSLSASFDPCSMDIPNVMMDPSGLLESLPAKPPDIGATIAAAKISLPDRVIVDDLKEATKDNMEVTEDLEPEEAKSYIEENNVLPVITGMGNSIKKLPTGEQVVETKSVYVQRIMTNHEIMDERNSEWDTKIAKYAKIKAARKVANLKWKEENPTLTGAKAFHGFRNAVKAGTITYYGSNVKTASPNNKNAKLISIDELGV